MLAKHFEESRQTVKIKRGWRTGGIIKSLSQPEQAGTLATNLLECPKKREKRGVLGDETASVLYVCVHQTY